MSQKLCFMLAMGAASLGTLLFIAAQPRFEIVAPTYARFAGIACFVVSGVFWALFGWQARNTE